MTQTQPDTTSTTTTYTAAIRQHDGQFTATIYRYIDGDHGTEYATVVVTGLPLDLVPQRLTECGWRVTSEWLNSRTEQGMALVASVTPTAVQPRSE